MADDRPVMHLGDPHDVETALDLVEALVTMNDAQFLAARVRASLWIAAERQGVTMVEPLLLALAEVAAFSVRSWAATFGAGDLDAQAAKGMDLIAFMRMHQRADADLQSLDEGFPFPEDSS